ncbi:MAG: cytochrome c [Lacunisphaera sp.]
MNIDRTAPLTVRARTGAVLLNGFNLAAIAALCLMATACGHREHDAADAAGPMLAASEREQQAGIAQAWKQQDRVVHEHLNSYGWVDRGAGVLHIPIERAMDLLLAEKTLAASEPRRPTHSVSREPDTPLENAGHRLFRQYGCSVCHDSNAENHAPSLVGIYGRRVRLNDGTFVRADDQYLHDSIMLSTKQVVAGYDPIMPAYANVIPETDVRELIAYLKSFSSATSTLTPPAQP